MYLFALMGVYVVVDSMLKIKVDSILKRYQIPFTASLVLVIVLLASFLITSFNSFFSVIILAAFALLLGLFFSILEWNNKRKQTQNPSYPNDKNSK
jgi:hypothetical protein